MVADSSTLRAGPLPDPQQRLWNPEVEELAPERLLELQWTRLQAELRYAYARSPFYRKTFDEAGVRPGDVRTWDDFRRVPVLAKDDLRRAQTESLETEGHPFGGITCAPREKVVRVNATSGTTGVPTLYTLTASDIAVVNEMHARKYWRAGVRPGTVMLQALSLSMFTGGLPLSQGIMHLGACVVPAGAEGGARRVLELARLTSAEAIVATPSFGELLIERCPELLGVPLTELGFKWFFSAGEPGGSIPEVRARLAEGFGARVFDHTGGGHGFHGITCDAEEGMHFVSGDHCLLELVEPKTRRPIPLADGAEGEMLVTWLAWEGGPFIRSSFGDVIRVATSPCRCGLPGLRFSIVGRADDMLIVRGVNVFPAAIQGVLATFVPRVTGHFRIVLRAPGPRVEGRLRLRVERGRGGEGEALASLGREMEARVRDELRVRPEIEWVEPESLPREAHKTKLILVESQGQGQG
ncbi:MAG: phenylacetate--CoA ligase family protein [Deltaproteobacteria bacterium]|nr:phenylacetate--CoA ligase family protein [Deltaproteobacteria bacterium]